VTDSPATSLHARLATRPGPALTWYGDAGERVELSGPVLAQWVTKASNLLVEELDAGPGYRMLLDLPGHWRAVVWAMAVWRVGACVVVADEAPGTDAEGRPAAGGPRATPVVDAVLTASPSSFTAGQHRATPEVVAVALPALARAFPGPLPDGVRDGSAVLAYGDALGYVTPAGPGAPALVGPSGSATHATLVRPGGDDGRMLLDATAGPLDELLRAVVDVLAAGGSVVLVGGGTAAQLRADDERRAALVASERVTGWAGRATAG
jgi:uncharacterized protein (TIGR03089 family)